MSEKCYTSLHFDEILVNIAKQQGKVEEPICATTNKFRVLFWSCSLHSTHDSKMLAQK